MTILHAGFSHWYEQAVQCMIEHNIALYNVCTSVLAVLMFLLLINKKNWRKRLFNHLMGCAIGVFAMGLVLYFIGFWHEGTAIIGWQAYSVRLRPQWKCLCQNQN